MMLLRKTDYQGSRITAMLIITTVMAAALGEKEILVSQTNGSYDNVTCGTNLQPCATFNYALSLFSKEGGTLVIDGGIRGKTIKSYVFHPYKDYVINGSLIIKKKLHQNHQSLSPLLIINNTVLNTGIIFCSGNLTITSIVLESMRFTRDKQYYIYTLLVEMPLYNHLVIRNCSLRFLSLSVTKTIIIDIRKSDILQLSFFKKCACYLIDTKVKSLTIHISNTSIALEHAVLSNGIVSVGNFFSEQKCQVYIQKSSFTNVSFNIFAEKIFVHHNNFIGGDKAKISLRFLLHQVTIYNCSFSNIPVIERRGHSMIIINSTFNSHRESSGYPALDIHSTTSLELVNSSFIKNNAIYGVPSAMKIKVNHLKIFNVIVNDRSQKNDNLVASIFVYNRTSIYGRVKIDKMIFLCYELSKGYATQNEYAYSLTYYCRRCPIGTYTLIFSVKTILSNFSVTTVISNLSTEVSKPNCHPCPFGGICNNEIQAKGGYWGYPVDVEVVFLRCPAFYCCSNVTTCKSYNTCAPNRVGRLCSLCKPGFTCSATGKPSCVNNRQCGDLYLNIFLYILTALFYIIIIMYLKEIILFIKQKCQRQNHQTEELTDYESHASMNELLLSDGPSQVLPHTNIKHIDDVSTSRALIGTVNVLFFFYQAIAIIRVDTSEKTKISFPILLDTVSSIFNVRPEISYSPFSICFMRDLQNLDIQLLKHGFTLFMLCIILSYFTLCEIYQYCRKTLSKTEQPPDESTFYENNQIDASVALYCNPPFSNRMKCAYVQILLIGFAGISTFGLQSVHCVEIDKKLYLFTQASIQCYQPWQIAVWIFICIWVIPFPFVLYCSCKFLYECLLTPAEFLMVLTFPPLLLYKVFSLRILNNIHPITIKDAMLSRHFLMVVNGPFREIQDGRRLCWEAMLMLMRVILVAVNTFIQSPMHKIIPNVLLLLLFLIIHDIVMPFKDAIVNTLEKASLILLISLSFVNNFWAFTNEYDLMASKGYRALAVFLLYYELFVILLPFLALITALIKITLVKLIRILKFCSSKQD